MITPPHTNTRTQGQRTARSAPLPRRFARSRLTKSVLPFRNRSPHARNQGIFGSLAELDQPSEPKTGRLVLFLPARPPSWRSHSQIRALRDLRHRPMKIVPESISVLGKALELEVGHR